MAEVSVRDRIAVLLNLSPEGPWEIVDRDDTHRVYLVSQTKVLEVLTSNNLTLVERVESPLGYENLRGVVVHIGDTPADDLVIVNNYVDTPRAVMTEVGADREIWTAQTLYNKTLALPVAECKFYAFYEGVIIRIFHFQGETYFTTFSRLNALKSQWAPPPAPAFGAAYIETGGTPLADLFPAAGVDTAGTHPWVYTLLVSHAALHVATLNDPQALYLLETTALGTPNGRVPVEAADANPPLSASAFGAFERGTGLTAKAAFERLLYGTVDHPHRAAIAPTLEDGIAKVTLRDSPPKPPIDPIVVFQFGDLPPVPAFVAPTDTRRGHGEAVIVEWRTSDGKVNRIKAESPGFRWRFDMRGNDGNPYKRFVMLTEQAFTPPAVYNETWPDYVTQMGFNLNNPFHRIVNIYYCFMMASPLAWWRPTTQYYITKLYGVAPPGPGMYMSPYDCPYTVPANMPDDQQHREAYAELNTVENYFVDRAWKTIKDEERELITEVVPRDFIGGLLHKPMPKTKDEIRDRIRRAFYVDGYQSVKLGSRSCTGEDIHKLIRFVRGYHRTKNHPDRKVVVLPAGHTTRQKAPKQSNERHAIKAGANPTSTSTSTSNANPTSNSTANPTTSASTASAKPTSNSNAASTSTSAKPTASNVSNSNAASTSSYTNPTRRPRQQRAPLTRKQIEDLAHKAMAAQHY